MEKAGLLRRTAQQLRMLLWLISLIALMGIAYIARDLLLPLTFAIFIAVAFRPPIKWLRQRGLPTWAGSLLCMGGLVSITLTYVSLVALPIVSAAANYPYFMNSIAAKISSIRARFREFLHWTEELSVVAGSEPLSANMPQVVVKENPVLDYLAVFTGYSASVLTTIAVAVVFAVYLMASGDLIYERLVKAIPRLSDKKRALGLLQDVEAEVSTYLLTVTAINAGFGLAVGLSFYALGMPSSVMWGAAAFVLNFVPYLGAVFAVSAALFHGMLVFDSIAYALLAPLFYIALNAVENQAVTPLLLGRRLELNAVGILLALAFWGWLWGIGGIVLAVPILIVLKVLATHLDSLATLGAFLAGEGGFLARSNHKVSASRPRIET